jgi:hypothetical protein
MGPLSKMQLLLKYSYNSPTLLKKKKKKNTFFLIKLNAKSIYEIDLNYKLFKDLQGRQKITI